MKLTHRILKINNGNVHNVLLKYTWTEFLDVPLFVLCVTASSTGVFDSQKEVYMPRHIDTNTGGLTFGTKPSI